MTPEYARWRPEFARAIDPIYGGADYLDYLLFGCGVAKFWPGENAAIVTRFSHFVPGCSIIEGLVAAGDLDEIVNELIPAAEQYGREKGCKFAVIESREGWQRALASSGYELHQVRLAKPL